jgi:hypothetical protein
MGILNLLPLNHHLKYQYVRPDFDQVELAGDIFKIKKINK